MQIVTDSSADLTPAQLKGIDVNVIPLLITMNNTTYRSGVDIQSSEFYQMLEDSNVFPSTSQPSAGDFAELYRSLAQKDPEILSIHLSAAFSGTYNSARLGAEQVPNAKVTLIDSKTISGALGWVVESVAQAIKAGWSRDEIMPLIKMVSDNTDTLYTIATLKYLVHGGRIGRVKGLVGSLMDFKPVIGIDKNEGINAPRGQVRTMKKGILHIADLIEQQYEKGMEMRIQVLHGKNHEGAEILRERLDKTYKCHFVDTAWLGPVLGAHTGPGLVGAVYAPWEPFSKLPWLKNS